MFGRKKNKSETFNEEDYYDDDELFDDEEDFEGEEEYFDDEAYIRELDSKNEYLTKEVSNLKAHIRVLKLNEDQKSNNTEESSQELERLNRITKRMKSELEEKQKEVDGLTKQLLEAAAPTQNLDAEKELSSLEQELKESQETIAKLKEDVIKAEINNSEIAEVLLEAKNFAKQTVSKAEFEAAQLMEDAHRKSEQAVIEAKTELKIVKKEATEYYQQLEFAKENMSFVFEQLLDKVATIKEK